MENNSSYTVLRKKEVFIVVIAKLCGIQLLLKLVDIIRNTFVIIMIHSDTDEISISCITSITIIIISPHSAVPPSPKNILVSKISSSAINVSWDQQTLVELKGLAEYMVTYGQINSDGKRQSSNTATVTVPWTENHVIISNLKSGAQYTVSVSATTSAGTSGNYTLSSE